MTHARPAHAIVSYSLSGHTARLAEDLADRLQADLIDLHTNRYRKGALSYILAGYDSLRGRLPRIDAVSELSGYDSLSIGTPVWAGRPATPVRAWLAGKPALPRVVGMFVTCGSKDTPTTAFEMARKLCGREFAATLSVPNPLELEPTAMERIAAYTEALEQASASLESVP